MATTAQQQKQLAQLADPKDIAAYLIKELANDDRIKIAGCASQPAHAHDNDRVDIGGILRGKILSKEKFLSVVKSGGLGASAISAHADMERILFGDFRMGYARQELRARQARQRQWRFSRHSRPHRRQIVRPEILEC